ncbi:terpenoid cyclases/protein prenyltransferase alpha-alpha toroid [Aspergillus karnatakaensis]|uniref:terpenoid cyclases/protein prenyltransferase alpha-alpha toroid n=1 Tax=Aspergillus karnatakaensis TaxID=1810916 RepID=UPI003CCCEFE5
MAQKYALKIRDRIDTYSTAPENTNHAFSERLDYPQDEPSRYYLGLPTGAASRPTATRPSEAVLNGALFHSRLQVKGLGCWAADLSCIFFVTPMLIISWYSTEAVIDEAHAVELVNFIMTNQNQDGGWATFCGEDTTLMGTILIYIALRLIGLSADNKALVRARSCLLDMGGAVYLSGWAKFWLAMLGLYSWEGTDPYPVEMWLLPEWVPISPWKWFIIPRHVYLAMSYLSTKGFTIPSNPLLDEIREENFVEPYEQVDFVAYRDTSVQRSREQRKPWILVVLNWILHNIWFAWLRPSSWVKRGLHEIWKVIEESEKATNSAGIISVDCFLNMIAFYAKEGPESEGLHRIHNASFEYPWKSPQGVQVMSVHGGHTWETALALQAYADAGVTDVPELRQTSQRAYSFLVKQQHSEDHSPDSPYHFFSRKGAWGFTVQYQGSPCSDCTAESLNAILSIETRPGVIQMTEEHQLQLAVDNLLLIQSSSGGYSSYEPVRGSQLLEYLNGTELFQTTMIDYNCTECTSSCISALAAYRNRNSAYRCDDIERAIKQGARYILRCQRPVGAWLGSWGIAFTYGTFFALEGLASAGLHYRNSEAVRRGCDYLLVKQQDDGGWGETMQSVITNTYVQAETSHIVQTAWVCLALMHAEYHDPTPIRRATQLMIRRQLPTGEWEQQWPVGCGIGTCELMYHNYVYSFPIRAIAMYKVRYGDEPVV